MFYIYKYVSWNYACYIVATQSQLILITQYIIGYKNFENIIINI